MDVHWRVTNRQRSYFYMNLKKSIELGNVAVYVLFLRVCTLCYQKPSTSENMTFMHANNTRADQHANSRSLISALLCALCIV